eukprot:499199-Pleurochrysis_carterae.AAC.1
MTNLQSLLLNDNLISVIDVEFPDSLVELDLSHNQIHALPADFAIPNTCDFWISKFGTGKSKPIPEKKQHLAKHQKPRSSIVCCGFDTADSDSESETSVSFVPGAPARTARRAHRLPRNMQPFR